MKQFWEEYWRVIVPSLIFVVLVAGPSLALWGWGAAGSSLLAWFLGVAAGIWGEFQRTRTEYLEIIEEIERARPLW